MTKPEQLTIAGVSLLTTDQRYCTLAISFCNNTASNVTINFKLTPLGGTSRYIFKDYNLSTTKPLIFNERLSLAIGDVITGYASVDNSVDVIVSYISDKT